MVAVGLTALSLAIAACGTSGNASASTPATATKTAVSAMRADLAKYEARVTKYPAVPKIKGGVGSLKGKDVWYVPIGDSVPILAAFGQGVENAMKTAGIKVHVCDGKFLPTDIATCLSEAQSQGADGVIASYIDYKMVPNSFKALVAHHIPVLIAGESNDSGKAASPKLAFEPGQSALDIAQRLQMESVITASGGKAHILFLGVTDSPSVEQGASYAVSYVKKHCPGCTLTEIKYNTAEIGNVPSQVSAALIANPDTNYVVDELDAAGPGTYQGIQQAGYLNKVKMAGTNGDLDGLQRIVNNQDQTVDVGISPIYSGWLFADGMLRMLKGQKPITSLPSVIRVFTKSNLGSLKLTPAEYETNDWYGSNTYEKTFDSAWGLK
jgi:ribose transport system substrate-binding protein